MVSKFFKKRKRAGSVYPAVDHATSETTATQPLKVLIVGDTGVGKTALANCLLTNNFFQTSNTTQEIRKKLLHSPNANIDLTLFDVQGGFSRFTEIGSTYIRQADIIFYVYDITDQSSFDHIREWLYRVSQTIDTDQQGVLIGNKADLTDAPKVQTEEANAFSQEHNLTFIETSAKNSPDTQDQLLTIILNSSALREKEATMNAILIESEIKSIAKQIYDEIDNEIKNFKSRKDVTVDAQFDFEDRKRQEALVEFQDDVKLISNELLINKKYLHNNDWRSEFQSALEATAKAYLEDKRVEKYSPLAKVGIRVLNLITFLFSPIKKAITNTWLFSTEGKTKETIEKTQGIIRKIDKKPKLK